MENLGKVGGVILGVAAIALVFVASNESLQKQSSQIAGITQESDESPASTQKNPPPTAEGWSTYESEAYRFSINHPPEMNVLPNEGVGILFTYAGEVSETGSGEDILSISSGSLGEKTLEEFANDQAASLRLLPGFEDTPVPQNLQVAGQTAYEFTANETDNQSKFIFVGTENNSYLK